uniref:Large ribosomal subunit protein uL14m n=1 Tax=Electrophorus electricus TaxID=8005 RepID=A0AAY5E9T5_ELEEL
LVQPDTVHSVLTERGTWKLCLGSENQLVSWSFAHLKHGLLTDHAYKAVISDTLQVFQVTDHHISHSYLILKVHSTLKKIKHLSNAFTIKCCFLSISAAVAAIQKLTRVRVIDNSTLGNTPYHRPPKVIHVYTKNGVGKVGDTVLLAIKGQKKKALIVGHKMPGARMTPRFDSNNVVLIEENGNPTGTRIKVPIPAHLRKMEGEYSKLLAIAQRFV